MSYSLLQGGTRSLDYARGIKIMADMLSIKISVPNQMEIGCEDAAR